MQDRFHGFASIGIELEVHALQMKNVNMPLANRILSQTLRIVVRGANPAADRLADPEFRVPSEDGRGA